MCAKCRAQTERDHVDAAAAALCNTEEDVFNVALYSAQKPW